MKGLGWAWGLVLLAEAAPQAGVEQRFRAYMDALNAHQVDKAMALLGPDLKLLREGRPVLRSRAQIRDIREWEIPLQARFEYTIYAVGGDRIAATVEETNLLYAALEVRRTMHAEYRFRDGQLIESHLRRIEERGRRSRRWRANGARPTPAPSTTRRSRRASPGSRSRPTARVSGTCT